MGATASNHTRNARKRKEDTSMIEIQFKALKLDKHLKHQLTYAAQEARGEAIIKSSITVCMEDSEMDFDQTIEAAIHAGLVIARKEYEKR